MNPTRRIRRCLGMTLTELLVVVAIMLLISAVAIPVLTPNDDQKGREAALTATTAIARAVARAEGNGTRGAGLWLEPLDPSSNGGLPSRGILDLFACQGQDDYQGDDPEVEPLVCVDANPGTPLTWWSPTDAVLLFSTLTSANIRVYCQKASRIQIERGGTEYYFRLLTIAEQQNVEGQLADAGLLPEPYSPSAITNPLQIGYYEKRKQLVNPGPWIAHSEMPSEFGDAIVAYARAIAPSTTPPPEPVLRFEPGVPLGAVLDKEGASIPAEVYVAPSNFPAVSVGSTYTIRRPITRSATPPLSLPAGFGVDIAWSTYGNFLLTNLATPLLGTGTRVQGIAGLLSNHPVCIMFSQAKDVTAVVFHRPETIGGLPTIIEDRLSLSSDVYLLIGRLDRAGLPYTPNPTKDQPGANWQYPDSRWVRISRAGGGTLIADPVLGVDNVHDSQGYARRGFEAARQ